MLSSSRVARTLVPSRRERKRRQPRAGESLSSVPASHTARRGGSSSSGTAEGKLAATDRARSRAGGEAWGGGERRAAEGGAPGRGGGHAHPPPVNSKVGVGLAASWGGGQRARRHEGKRERISRLGGLQKL